MHHFVVLRTVKDKGGSAIISVVSATEKQQSKTLLSLLNILKHSGTPRCTLHTLTLDYMPSFNPSPFSVWKLLSTPPKKKDASVVKKYSYVPDSTTLDVVLTHPRHSI